MIPLLSGIISSLVGCLEEPDEIIQKMIFESLQKINLFVGNKFYISTLWQLLINSSTARSNVIKVFEKKFRDIPESFEKEIITKELEQLNIREFIEKTNNYKSSYFPCGSMISNAISVSLQSEDLSLIKSTLDFITKYANPFQMKLLNSSEILPISGGLLKLITLNDYAINKRIFKLLFGNNDLNTVLFSDLVTEKDFKIPCSRICCNN